MLTGGTRLAVAVIACVGGLLFTLPLEARAALPEFAGCGFETGPERSVVRIVDAGTVELDDKTQVRLAAILPPRADEVGAAPGQWPPEAAAERALADLLQGRTVALAFAGPRSDRYGRTLAHLVVRDGDRLLWVQHQLAAAGHARVFAWPDGEGCVERLLTVEAQARRARLGMWAEAAYQVRPADRPSELQRYGGTFQIVRGNVAHVGGTRARLVLELASGEVRAARLRIVVPRASAAAKALGGGRGLADAEIEVRGWIAAANRGPEIELQALHQLRRLSVAEPAEPERTTPGR